MSYDSVVLRSIFVSSFDFGQCSLRLHVGHVNGIACVCNVTYATVRLISNFIGLAVPATLYSS